MEKIFGDKGDVVIFDTHGWHSHIKKNTSERVVLEITIIPKNFLFNSPQKSNLQLNNLL
jgi:ectoine hydroxylase-related dioxygenase (phytanoyl-CoA dioxygenase family)